MTRYYTMRLIYADPMQNYEASNVSEEWVRSQARKWAMRGGPKPLYAVFIRWKR